VDPKALLDAGRLTEAAAALTQQVRSKPADMAARRFLFETLAFQGDYDRALKQLDAIDAQAGGPQMELAIAVYRQLVEADKARAAVFDGEGLPKFFVPPPAGVDGYLTLLSQMRSLGSELGARVEALEAALPAVSGTVNGRRFSSFRDIDDRLAPVFEVFHEGAYLWLPVAQVRRLEVVAPVRLRELLWLPVKVEVFKGDVGNVFLPALYPGSAREQDDRLRLGRMTDWRDVDGQLVYGVGQRTFLVDEDEIAFLDIREIVFDAPAETAE
jgi:type VI secretion system protein ImpE